jgi:hypothetical protein
MWLRTKEKLRGDFGSFGGLENKTFQEKKLLLFSLTKIAAISFLLSLSNSNDTQ